MIGQRLGHYEVVAKLGEGGMGEVYRATDTKLGRDVAIKILPAAVATDAERRARFEREARALAALNHPNIAHLHGLDERLSTGPARPIITALVMELVDGDDLSAHIARGPMPLGEALPIARQIADALEAAHERGIIHRDLKPQNIKVTADGTVKVLDFGLAKAFDLSSSDPGVRSDAANSPTLTNRATQLGLILGTAAYMAPEQARGKAVDKRADIWAFGVVVYEMLAGRRAFPGEEISDVLAAVLRQQIDWSALPSDTPPRLRHLLERCLDRDVKTRLRDIGEARVALASPVAAIPAPAPGPAPDARTGDRRRVSWPVTAGIATVAAALAAVAVWNLRPAASAAQPSPVLLPFNAPDNVVSEVGDATISPDGTTILFSGRGADGRKVLWLRRLDAVAATPLPDTEDAIEPFWSPDSTSIAFGAQGKLKRLDIGATRAHVLTDAARSNNGTWSREGVIVFSPDYGTQLFKVAATGGPRTRVTPEGDRGAGGARYPVFLPDGRHFLYVSFAQRVFVGSIDAMAPKDLGITGAVVFAPPHWVLYVRNGVVVAHAFDLTALELIGQPRPIAPMESDDGWGRGSRLSVSGNGVLVMARADAYDYQLAWFEPNGRPAGTLGPVRSVSAIQVPRISPDGSRVVVQINDAKAQNQDLWLGHAATGSFERFTTARQFDQLPVWSSDSAHVFMASSVEGVTGLFRIGVAGGAYDTVATGLFFPQDASRDGRWLYYTHRGDATRLDIWAWPLANGVAPSEAKPHVIANAEFDEGSPKVSPDGQWLAYQSDITGTIEVYVRRLAGGVAGPAFKVTTGHGTMPHWSNDGRRLFYVSAPHGLLSAQMMSVGATPAGDRLQFSAPTPLFKARMLPVGTITRDYDIAPDGRFLVGTVVGPAKSTAATVVLNWPAILR